MSENDSSHIDTVADLVGFDTCQYSWVVRVSLKYMFWFLFVHEYEQIIEFLVHKVRM